MRQVCCILLSTLVISLALDHEEDEVVTRWDEAGGGENRFTAHG